MLRIVFLLPFVIMLILTGSGVSQAQSLNGGERKQMRATRLDGAELKFDGRLDDPAWQEVSWVSDFLQKEPNEGAVPAEETHVAILFDDHFLYIGARMSSDEPSALYGVLNRRDNPGNCEQIIVSLDTYLDRRTCYEFGVSAAGVRTDRYHPADDEYWRDMSYDPVWDARTDINESGWTAEMRIPFSQLRFSKNDRQVWGINLNRWIPRRREDNFWIYVPRDETGWSSRFGDLVGIEGIAPSRRLELLPYAAGDGRFVSNVSKDNPFIGNSEADTRFGGDLKMGLGPNLTLDATINPDFGQVEADPAVVNLSAFETFFQERRPFFTEGRQLFDPIGPSFFYSRRIGGSPHGDAEGDFVERPTNTTILGAGKVTGRLSSGTSIGVLTAITSREDARIYDSTTDIRSRTAIEPLTGYGVVRLQQEFGKDKSTAGLFFTALERDLKSGEPLSEVLRRRAFTGNADWQLRFKGGEYEISGHAGFSNVAGDTAVMRKTQEASAHYFQRPDADHVSFDPTRTSMTGYTASLRANRRSGRHWLWSAGVSMESPELELNDAGILGAADDIDAGANIRYRENVPGPVFRNYNIGLYSNNGWNFGGVKQYRNIELNLNATWRNWWNTYLFVGVETRAESDSYTRGGPLMGTAQGWWAGTGTSSNFSSNTRYGFSTYGNQSELGDWRYEFGFNVSTRAGRRWSMSIAPQYQRRMNRRQYIDTRDDGTAATFGGRYIFSSIEQSQLSMDLRVNYYFTPDLSLEVYARPFAASGRYYAFGELPAAGSLDLREYGSDGTTISETSDGEYAITDNGTEFTIHQSDFGFRSFRSNMVLRWEFRRGSTLFLVWQQNRSGDEAAGRLIGPRALGRVFSAEGDNFLAIKIAYWIPVS